MRKLFIVKRLYVKEQPGYKVPQISQLDKTLQKHFPDLMGVCSLFNKHIDKKPLDIDWIPRNISIRHYRLMEFRTLDKARLIHDVDSAYHIGLLVTPVYVLEQPQVAFQFCSLKCSAGGGWGLPFGFRCWEGISVPKGDDQEWMVTRLREEASGLVS